MKRTMLAIALLFVNSLVVAGTLVFPASLKCTDYTCLACSAPDAGGDCTAIPSDWDYATFPLPDGVYNYAPSAPDGGGIQILAKPTIASGEYGPVQGTYIILNAPQNISYDKTKASNPNFKMNQAPVRIICQAPQVAQCWVATN